MPLLHTALDRGRISWLKWLVVATAVAPLKSLYIGLYRLTIWWVGRRLARDPPWLAAKKDSAEWVDDPF